MTFAEDPNVRLFACHLCPALYPPPVMDWTKGKRDRSWSSGDMGYAEMGFGVGLPGQSVRTEIPGR